MTHGTRERDAAATNEDASLRRRLRFDGDTRFVFDRIGARLKRSARIHRIPERLVVTAFDLVESARQRRPVPSLGNPIRAFTRAATQLPQHPRYPGFLFEQHHNAVVGLHLGVDLIHSHDGFYVLEMNLDAAMGPPRRVLYPEAIDPIVTGILESARAHGQKRVVVFRQVWRGDYVEEFLRGGREFGIEVVPASIWGDREPPGYPLVGFPPQREPDTLYVSFSSRHAPIDHFVHDKDHTSKWLPRFLPGHAANTGVAVRAVPTFDTPFVPEVDADPRWPNMVVKLASWDRGLYVRFLRLKGEDVLQELGMNDPSDQPAVLDQSLRHRLEARIMSREGVLYQPFVRSLARPDRRTYTIRLHLLVTPMESRFLSAHCVVAAAPLPEALPYGPVQDTQPFLTNFATYARLDPDAEADLSKAAVLLGDAVRAGISATFETLA